MNYSFVTVTAPDRRGFVRLAMGSAGTVLLVGCGGAGAGAMSGGTTGVTAAAAQGTSSSDKERMTLALNLEYLGAQFHAFASSGAGLPSALTTGLGQQGAMANGRAATLVDPLVRSRAAELAADKLAHVAGLRGALAALGSGSGPAQPMLDLSASGAFATAARAAGLTTAGGAFDPYADDDSYLLGSLLIENAVAATYRTLVTATATASSAELMSANLADAIYHGGLVRSLLAARVAETPALGANVTALSDYLARLDGTATGDQDVATATGSSANLLDADGRAVPFLRDAGQALRALYLNPGQAGAGGFFPAGVVGVVA